jgi:hypothetical protein
MFFTLLSFFFPVLLSSSVLWPIAWNEGFEVGKGWQLCLVGPWKNKHLVYCIGLGSKFDVLVLPAHVQDGSKCSFHVRMEWTRILKHCCNHLSPPSSFAAVVEQGCCRHNRQITSWAFLPVHKWYHCKRDKDGCANRTVQWLQSTTDGNAHWFYLTV